MKKTFWQNRIHDDVALDQHRCVVDVPGTLRPERQINQRPLQKYCGLVVAALLLGTASLACAQTTNMYINSFDLSYQGQYNVQGAAPLACDSAWGAGIISWDGNQDVTGNGGGAAYIQAGFTNNDSSGTPIIDFICFPPYDNWYWNGNGNVDLALYTAVRFDIKWDNSSTMTIGQFNNPSLIQSSLAGSYQGLDVDYTTGGGDAGLIGVITNIPSAASNGWVTVTVPIPPTLSGTAGTCGILLHKWIANEGGLTNFLTANFWVDNVELIGNAAPPPPPTINQPVKNSVSGLSIYASTEGNSFYDRQSVLYTTNSGTSWLSPGVTYPVSYSFTIADFPTNADSYGCEAWLFLSPNPAAIDNAPDWNETNMVISFIQMNTNGATMNFQYKVNEDHQQAMYSGGSETRTVGTNTYNYYYSAAPGSMPGGPITNDVSPGVYNVTNESGNLGSLVNPGGADGTWTITFTSANDVTLTAPGGNTTNLVIPAYNAPYLAPGANGMNIYLGMQANNAASINQRVVYSNFAISGGVPTTFSDNFAADSVLNTTDWATAQATGPKGILITKPGWMFTWSLPDGGFTPQIGASLTNSLNWITPASSGLFSLYGENGQLVSGSDLPGGNTAFFRLIKRQYTQLQILLPGETNAPGTTTGIVGTPVALTNGVPFTVTINACDSTWHIVNFSGGSINLTSSTAGTFNFVPQSAAPLANGSVQMNAEFDISGPQTITATDSLNTNIPPVTSSSVTVN